MKLPWVDRKKSYIREVLIKFPSKKTEKQGAARPHPKSWVISAVEYETESGDMSVVRMSRSG